MYGASSCSSERAESEILGESLCGVTMIVVMEADSERGLFSKMFPVDLVASKENINEDLEVETP